MVSRMGALTPLKQGPGAEAGGKGAGHKRQVNEEGAER